MFRRDADVALSFQEGDQMDQAFFPLFLGSTPDPAGQRFEPGHPLRFELPSGVALPLHADPGAQREIILNM